MCQDEIFWLERQLWGRVTRPGSSLNQACSAACFVQEILLSDLLLHVVQQGCQRGPALGLGTMSSDEDWRLDSLSFPHFGCPTARASIPCVGGRQPPCHVGPDPLSLQSCASGPLTTLPATKEDHRRRELRRNQLGT